MSISPLIRAAALVAFALLLPPSAQSQDLEKRVALVVGNGAYQEGALSTPPNDAGLIAQTLQAAGFDVVGARDLDMTTLRSSFREFLDKVATSGPNTVALVYFAGHALQFEGDNYLVPVDARLARDSDVPIEAFRLSDLTRPLATMPLKARIVILDGAHANEFAKGSQPLAGGLALVQPDDGMLIAFNAAPGTIGPESKAAYGAYATALSEMIKEGGLPLDELFERVRLRVNEVTGGTEIPWNASRIQTPFVFFERTDAAPQAQADDLADINAKPIAQMDARDAYLAALARDSFRGYQEFLAAYPDDPLAKRVRAILAARREAATWRESVSNDTPQAYWSYLQRYRRGPHAHEAQRRLNHFAAALEPPPDYAAIEYDVPAPPPEEIVYVEGPVMDYGDPAYDLPPPPPIPTVFLPPQPAYYVDYPPPPPPVEAYVLPIPIYRPVPVWVDRPAYVAPPPVNIVNVNIHNTVVVNEQTRTTIVTNAQGQQVPPLPANFLRQANPALAARGAAVQPRRIEQHPAVSAAIAATAVPLPSLALRNRQQPSRLNLPAQAGGQTPNNPRVPMTPQGAVPGRQPPLLPNQAPAVSTRQQQASPQGGPVRLPAGQAIGPANRRLPKPVSPVPVGGQVGVPSDTAARPSLPTPSTAPAVQSLPKQIPRLAQPSDQPGNRQALPSQNPQQRLDRQRQNATQQQQLLIQRQQATQRQQQAGQQRAVQQAQQAPQRAQQQQRAMQQQAAQRAQQQLLIQRQQAAQRQQQAGQQRAMQQQAQQAAQRVQQQRTVQQRAVQQQQRTVQQRAMQQQRPQQTRPQQGKRPDCGGPGQSPCQ